MNLSDVFNEYAIENNLKENTKEYIKAKADFFSGYFYALDIQDIELVKQLLNSKHVTDNNKDLYKENDL